MKKVDLSKTQNGIGVESRDAEKIGPNVDLSVIVEKLLDKVQPDIKKCNYVVWRGICFLVYVVAITLVIYIITRQICCTVNKVEVQGLFQGQVITTINNNAVMCSLMLFLLAIVVIICPLFFLIYGNKKNKEQEDYAITNNESYYKMVHHIVNVVSEMEMRDKQKELQNQQPSITEKDLKTILEKCIEEQKKECDSSARELLGKVDEVEAEIQQLSTDVRGLDHRLSQNSYLINIEHVVKLAKVLSANGTAKDDNG